MLYYRASSIRTKKPTPRRARSRRGQAIRKTPSRLLPRRVNYERGCGPALPPSPRHRGLPRLAEAGRCTVAYADRAGARGGRRRPDYLNAVRASDAWWPARDESALMLTGSPLFGA